MRKMGKVAVALAGVLLGASCGLFDDDGEIDIQIAAEALVVTPSEPALLRVTAVNRGDSRVVWGRGSSSCQFGLLARVEDRFLRAQEDRACTSDLAAQGLEPGESRTEELPWSGYVVRDGTATVLPPGRYEIRGFAGSAAWSAPVRITLQED